MATRKKMVQRYKVTRTITYGDVPFRLEVGHEFTKADLLPGMAAALAKWLRAGAVVEIVENQKGDTGEGKSKPPGKIQPHLSHQ